MNNFSIIIQNFKFHGNFILLSSSCSEMTAMLSCHVQKFCSDMIPYNWVILKPIFHRTWIMMEKSFMKWAPVDFTHTFPSIHKHHGCHMIAPVAVNQPWSTWVNQLYQLNICWPYNHDNLGIILCMWPANERWCNVVSLARRTHKMIPTIHSTTKLCPYFLGHKCTPIQWRPFIARFIIANIL